MNKVGFVEYCPRCGRINPDPACQDCATHAVMMPTAIAEQAQAGFKASTQFVGWPEINKEPLGIKAPRPFDPMNAPSGFVAVQKETGERCALCSFSNDQPACAAAPCQPDARPDESWAYFSPTQHGEPGGLTVSQEQAEREAEKPSRVAELTAEVERLRKAARGLLDHVYRETCTHEETYRGGHIWEICCACDRKWADDEGGKPEFAYPKCVQEAEAALSGKEAQE